MASKLYPPIVDYSMPAFDKNSKEIRIYFALSSYNKISEVVGAHMTVRYQTDNTNALSSSYPAKIKVCSISEITPEEDATIAATDARYYITLRASDLAKGKFEQGIVYKIQIRFTKHDQSKENPDSDYFNTHLSDFSEWSTVCLIRGITVPTYSIVQFDEVDIEDMGSTSITLASLDATFLGTYTPGESSETLQTWRMRLYNETKETLLGDTGYNTYNAYNYAPTDENGTIAFEGIIPYALTSSTSYVLILDIETKNGYKSSAEYAFTAMSYVQDPIDGTITLKIDETDAYAKIVITTNDAISNNITLRRTSSKSNFTVWEDLANKTFTNEMVNWEYDDFTIESGVFYQYGAQTRDNRGRRGVLLVTDVQMGEFEDAFLLEKSGTLSEVKQLKLRYDFQISSKTTNISESKTDTIGSVYPYIKRNGTMYYRSFQCTGLITAYMDMTANLLTTPQKLLDNNKSRYDAIWNKVNYRVNTYDYTYERKFREAVEEFLYDDKVKLFKSLQEGNILVKLMDISLTPVQELGRLLYKFSATAYEIDEVTIPNLAAYGLLTVGTYNPNITFGETTLGQLNTYLEPLTGGTDIIQKIKEKYHFGEAIDGIMIDDLYLSHLRIEFDSDPYLIRRNADGNLVPFDDIEDADGQEIYTDPDVLDVGWLLRINGETILVKPPNNVYELKGDTVHISSGWQVSVVKDFEGTIDFLVNFSKSVDNSDVASVMYYKQVLGQQINTYQPYTDVITEIWHKYYVDNEEYYNKVVGVYTLTIDAEPGTVFYAHSNAVSDYTRFVIGESGILFLDPGVDNVAIQNLYFYGMNIDTRYTEANYGADGHTKFVANHYKQSQPEHPVQYDYYDNGDGTIKMFYKGNWYTGATNDGGITYDLECPVDAMIFYNIETVKGIY